MYTLRSSLSLRVLLGCTLLVISVAAARADDTYTYSFDGPGISGSGTVSLAPGPVDGGYTVTYIDGQVNSIAISGLLDTGTYHSNDNLFYAGDNYLDGQGVAFGLADGAQVGIYYNAAEDSYYFVGDGTFQLDTGVGPMTQSMGRFAMNFATRNSVGVNLQLSDFSFAPVAEVASTPEPSGLMLLGTGVLATAGMVRRRLRRA